MWQILTSLALCGELTTTERAGQAGAGTANPGDLAAGRDVPAAMVLDSAKSSQTDFAWNGGWNLGLGAMDSETNALGAAVVYSRRWADEMPAAEDMPGWVTVGEDENRVRENATRLSLGYGFGEQAVAGPMGARRVRRAGLGASVIYEHNSSDLLGSEDLYELDLSAAARIGPTAGFGHDLTVAVAVRDLLPNQARPVSGQAGVYWRPLPPISVSADALYDPDAGRTWGGRGGAQLLLNQTVSLTAGYANQGQHQVGAGLGAHGQGFKLHAAAMWTPATQSWLYTAGLVTPL
ncbi:MAG: hypothetical protein VX899_22880 [Myxococcota bacterium]|nr:hypothetical protein [Myxococcota bacterium]